MTPILLLGRQPVPDLRPDVAALWVLTSTSDSTSAGAD